MAVHTNPPDPNKEPQKPTTGPSTVMGDALRQAGIGASTQTGTQPAPQPQQKTIQEPRMSAQNPTNALSAFNLNSSLRRPVPRLPAGEKVQTLVKSLKKLADDIVTNEELRNAITFEILDENSDQVFLNTILVCMNVQGGAGNGYHVGVFELLVDDPNQTLQDIVINNGYGQTTIKRTAGDVADNELWEKAKLAVANRIGNSATPHFAGSMVLPASLGADDEYHLRAVLFTATQAIYTVLEEEVLGDEPGIQIPALVSKAQLQVVLDYAAGNAETATALPVRSDISVVLKASEITQGQNQSLHRKSSELTRVDGFVDFILNPPLPPAYGQTPKTAFLNPRYVITRMDSRIDAITLESQLLGLASAFTVGYQYAWAGSFLARFASSAMRGGGGKKGPELRDLGAIGLEVALDDKGLARHSVLTTKTEDKDLQALVNYAINPEIVFTLQIEEVGELTWIQEVFLAAARGNDKAYDRIVRAADTLTAGQFSTRWQKHQANGQINPIVFDDKVRQPLGYYVDPTTQEQYSLDKIDYLALLNVIGEKDMGMVRRWQQTFDNINTPADKRTEERFKILEEVIGGGRIVLTGHASRVSFSHAFLAALNESCAAAGADIRPANLQLDFSGGGGRALYNLAQTAIAPGQLSGMFSSGTGAGPGRSWQSGVHTRY